MSHDMPAWAQLISEDVREIKERQLDLIKQGAVHNELLRTHETRSLALQTDQKVLSTRVETVEKHVYWVNRVLSGLGLVAVGVAAQWAIRTFL